MMNQGIGFDQTCIDTFLEEVKSRLNFGDFDLIFKVTTALGYVQNKVSGHYHLNQQMDFDQTCIDT